MEQTKGWQEIAIARNSGKETPIESLGNDYWIIPQKLSIDVIQLIASANNVELDEYEISGKTDEEIDALISEKIKKSKGKRIFDEKTQKMVRLAFLFGVHNHNLNAPVVNDAGESVMDKDGNRKMVKVSWDEDLYNEMRKYPDALVEIFKIVMEFNRPLAKETSEK